MTTRSEFRSVIGRATYSRMLVALDRVSVPDKAGALDDLGTFLRLANRALAQSQATPTRRERCAELMRETVSALIEGGLIDPRSSWR